MSATPSFTCATCGGTHEGLPTDFSFTLPDDVWAIPADERHERANWSSEFCDFGERRFVRCYLEIPFVGRDETFSFSAWVEVTPAEFMRFVYPEDHPDAPPAHGTLANRLPGFADAADADVLVASGIGTKRPRVTLPSTSSSTLARDQRDGIDAARHHAILLANGIDVFAMPEAATNDAGPREYASVRVWENDEAVLHVAHDHEDDWILSVGDEPDEADAWLRMHKEHLAERDPTLRDAFDLPTGWKATRTNVGGVWNRTALDNGDRDAAS